MKQALSINDNKLKKLFTNCLGDYYPTFIDALGHLNNGGQLVVPSTEGQMMMIVKKVDDTHIKVNFELF